jgi:hypothetical protein
MTQNKNSINGLVFGAVGVAVSILGFMSATTISLAVADRLLYVSNTFLSLLFSLILMHDSLYNLTIRGQNGTYIHG